MGSEPEPARGPEPDAGPPAVPRNRWRVNKNDNTHAIRGCALPLTSHRPFAVMFLSRGCPGSAARLQLLHEPIDFGHRIVLGHHVRLDQADVLLLGLGFDSFGWLVQDRKDSGFRRR